MLESLPLAEKARNEHFLRRIADVTPGVIEVFDLDKQSTLFSSRCIATLLGYSTDEIEAMAAGLVPALMHEDDLPRFAAHRQCLRKLGDHETVDFEYRLRERSGGWRWIQNRDAVFARDVSGAVSQIISNAVDINERKNAQEKLRRSEEVYRLTFDLSPMGMASADSESRFTKVNQRFCEITGYPADELLCMTVCALTHPDDLAASRVEIDQLLAGEVEHCDTEKRYLRKDGSVCWVRVIVRMVRDAFGLPLHSIGVVEDINERRQAEQALREQKTRYHSLFDSMQEGYFLGEMLFDADGKPVDLLFVETNPAFEAQTGLQGAKGRRLSTLLPAIEPFWIETYGKVALSGEPASFESEAKSLGRFLEVKAHRIGGPHSRKVGVVFSDITGRKRAEAAVTQNIGLFTRMLEQAPTGMFVVDARFRLQQVNALAAPVFASIHPLIGRDFAEIMEIFWGPVVGAQCTAIFRHTLASGERYVSPPFYERRFDIGEDQAFDWETQRVTLPDGQHGVVCYFQETTLRQRAEMALRDSEERMRLATEATGVGVWQWNLNTGMVRWDAQMFRIYGIAPTADGCVQYTDWSGSVHPEDLDTQEETLRDTVRQLGSSSLDFRIQRRSDGQCRYIHAAETIRETAEGQDEWMVGTNLDVTERKLGEERIRSLLEDLRLADSRKDEFLATLAHELRNPLAAVSNSLELMKRASANTGLLERVHATMERQMAQMVHLIDDLLDVSRITLNRIELRLERIELASVVEHAVEASRPQCERAGHQLHVTLPPGPISLNADPLRLAQVFGNLLNNACKYTPPGGNIWLSAERQGSEVALTVKDSGLGIAPEMLHKVFELFTQVGSSMDQSQGGLGIGLSLAKRLTELHGGTLTAHSEGQDLGSEFVVRLPVLLETIMPAAPVPIVVPAPQATRRILVVDDKRDSADSLAMLLGMGGDETQTAYDGVEAVASAAAFRPDVILLDIGMPKMNGYDACRAIRQQPGGRSIAIIAMTGWGQDEDRRKSRDAGFDYHLVKPVDFQQLMTLLAAPKAAGQ
jgi:PAS domain S-box-containing protein